MLCPGIGAGSIELPKDLRLVQEWGICALNLEDDHISKPLLPATYRNISTMSREICRGQITSGLNTDDVVVSGAAAIA